MGMCGKEFLEKVSEGKIKMNTLLTFYIVHVEAK